MKPHQDQVHWRCLIVPPRCICTNELPRNYLKSPKSELLSSLCSPALFAQQATASAHSGTTLLPLPPKDGSGAVSERVSADFGFVGFGFGFQSSPADFGFRYPKKFGFGADFKFDPRITIGGPKLSAQYRPT